MGLHIHYERERERESECWPPFLVCRLYSAATIFKATFAQFYHNNTPAKSARLNVGAVEDLDTGPCDCILTESRDEYRLPNLLNLLDVNRG